MLNLFRWITIKLIALILEISILTPQLISYFSTMNRISLGFWRYARQLKRQILESLFGHLMSNKLCKFSKNLRPWSQNSYTPHTWIIRHISGDKSKHFISITESQIRNSYQHCHLKMPYRTMLFMKENQ